ncbi:TIGR01777 family oxidoreductase [Flavobacterium sp. MFBS3-15]|uniref:TIGR01777 family oxidoreductase n=1 Tax=Flavobacterium sp. MFBS3-15 TaxID=2989816 RepID=UPI0022356232|nr:TIGR01777 family oxidoreductase [Flavobacterium sp. MFBS3-15]MCW4467539.1 TIGR01777 family oxidoreductase [Flavobacterium sp. MFBS3-15]
MKVLITGATGLVGTELVSLLLKNGIHIHYLTTSEKKLQHETQYKGFLWDPEKGEADVRCIEDVDAIIHLAGASISRRWTDAYKEEILESRVVSANLLYKILKNHNHTVKHFISASAIGIYPDSTDKVYSEDSPEADDSFLGQVVTKWEQAADLFSQLGISVTKIRTGLVLSGKGGMLKELELPVKFGLGAAFGNGKQMQSWIHLRDLVGIYHFVLMHHLEGIYNAVAPYPVSQKQLIRQIAEALKVPFFLPGIPKFMMKAILGDMHELLYSSQNASAKKIIGEGYQFRYLSLEKALKQELH